MSFGGFVHTIMFSRPRALHCIECQTTYTQFYALTGQVDSRIICSRYIFVFLALWLNLMGGLNTPYWAVNMTTTADCNLSLVINAMCTFGQRFVPSNIGQREAVWET